MIVILYLFVTHCRPQDVIVIADTDDEDDYGDEFDDGEFASQEPEEPEEAGTEARFFNPPLYLQRYDAVLDILGQAKWIKHMGKVENDH